MKTLTVLGATSEVAEQFVYAFLKDKKEPWRVVLSSRSVDRLAALQADLTVRKLADEVQLLALDAADYARHAALLGSLPQETDVVLCAMGYLGDQKIAENDWTEAVKILDANYRGPVSLLEIFARAFEGKGSGSIIGISSVAGDRGRASNYFYGSAKAGFTTYLSGLRQRFSKQGVHVLTVIPGFMDTKMTEGLNPPKPVTASALQAGKHIYQSFAKKKQVVYVLPLWRIIMTIIRFVPEAIFMKLSF